MIIEICNGFIVYLFFLALSNDIIYCSAAVSKCALWMLPFTEVVIEINDLPNVIPEKTLLFSSSFSFNAVDPYSVCLIIIIIILFVDIIASLIVIIIGEVISLLEVTRVDICIHVSIKFWSPTIPCKMALFRTIIKLFYLLLIILKIFLIILVLVVEIIIHF